VFQESKQNKIQIQDLPKLLGLDKISQAQIVGGSTYNQAGNMIARWDFKQTFPQKYELSSLKVDDQQLLLETIVLMHEGVERVQ
jgi:phage tail-like protein